MRTALRRADRRSDAFVEYALLRKCKNLSHSHKELKTFVQRGQAKGSVITQPMACLFDHSCNFRIFLVRSPFLEWLRIRRRTRIWH